MCKKQTVVWMLYCVWMGYLLLIFGAQWLKFYDQPTTLSNLNIVASRKLVRPCIPKPRHRMPKEGRRLSNWVMWTTAPQRQILLQASLSCTSLKTMKQLSKWSLRAEVQRWDTCQEPTELRLIGYLTESIWILRSKSNTLTPKTNSQTRWPKEVSQEMNGNIFLVCWKSWFSLCFSCSHFLSNRKHSVMSKRAQEKYF